MINRNYLFIITSIILGLIISYYYNSTFNKDFYLLFIMTSVIFYILFYFLGSNNKTQIHENYDNYNTDNLLNNINWEDKEVKKLLQNIQHLDNQDYVEQMINNKYHLYQEEEEEEHPHLKYIINKELKQTVEEEEQTYHPTTTTPTQEESTFPISLVPTSESGTGVPEEESFTKPNLNNIVLPNLVGKEGYGPLNINISYNSQNSTNTLNDGISNPPNSEDSYKLTHPIKKPSKNLGPISDCSRIYNNSDWIYGSNAWTNDPDYYIPGKDCPASIVSNGRPPLNEIAMKNFENTNDVCPLEINTPWSQWKSGDSDPEPYNM